MIAGVVGRELEPRRATRAVFRGAAGEPLDTGLALYFPAPNSYTGEASSSCTATAAPRCCDFC